MVTEDRLHALDAVRAFALLAGIVLHASMSFFLGIPAADRSQSVTLGVGFYVIHLFRMSTFYLIAGFFAHLLVERRGLRGLVRDRTKRIVVPMLVGWVVLAPPTLVAAVWGLARTAAQASADGLPAVVTERPPGFPLLHLWFLYYLCLFYVAAIAVRAVAGTLDRRGRLASGIDALVRAGLRTGALVLVLAAPTAAMFHALPDWFPWFGIPTPDTGLAPQRPALIAYGTAFGFGWLLHRQTVLLGELRRTWLVYLVVAIMLTVGCLSIVGLLPDLNAPAVIEGPTVLRGWYAAGYALAIWCWTFALVGAAVRFCSKPSATGRYLADSSYWLYLWHLPVVFFLQAALMNVPLHWSLKFPLILAVTLAVLLVTYRRWVRPTVIGEWLNGRRYPPAGQSARNAPG